jgi:hypothetical protein
MATKIDPSNTIHKYVTVWWTGVRLRVYPSSSLGYAMREAKNIIESEAFSIHHELVVCPFDLLEVSGECQNLLPREDLEAWYKAHRPWFKGGTYVPPKDARREQRGLSPHSYPPFVPRPEEDHRLPYTPRTETPVVQRILEDHEERRKGIERFLNHGYETYNIKVSREDGSEEKVL